MRKTPLYLMLSVKEKMRDLFVSSSLLFYQPPALISTDSQFPRFFFPLLYQVSINIHF